MKLALLIISGILFNASLAYSIGRTGNGGKIADATDGFEASIPSEYVSGLDRKLRNDGLQVKSPFNIGLGLSPLAIEFRKLSAEFPNFGQLSRAEISQFLIKHIWNYSQVENQCVDVYWVTNSSASNLIALWGSQKGVVILGTSANLLAQIQDIAKSIELDYGACDWK